MDEEALAAISTIGDQIDVAITECTNAILGMRFPEPSTEGIENALASHAAGIEKALKAHTKKMAEMMRTEVDDRVPALLEQLIAIMGTKEEVIERGAVEFRIKRDNNGYMTSIIAAHGEHKEPDQQVTYN